MALTLDDFGSETSWLLRDADNNLLASGGPYNDFEAGKDFLECYHAGRQYNIEDAGKVSSMLKKVIEDHKLDAITVECFSLVQEKNVTACLGLSFLNDLGIPAGCEGDICSIIGLMIAKELTGALPWMANIAGISGSVKKEMGANNDN